jgi:SRSO17 transposase
LKRAGVPVEYRTARTKPEIALAEIDRVTAAGVRFGCVLADAGYGLSAPFRQGVTARNHAWAVGIPRHLKVYPVDVRMKSAILVAFWKVIPKPLRLKSV